MQERIEHFLAKVAQALGEQREESALLAVSAMVGGLLLSRVMTNPNWSDERRCCTDHAEDEVTPTPERLMLPRLKCARSSGVQHPTCG